MTEEKRKRIKQKIEEFKRRHSKRVAQAKDSKPLAKPVKHKKEEKKEQRGSAGKKKKKVRMVGPGGGQFVITEGGKKRYVKEGIKKALEVFVNAEKIQQFIMKRKTKNEQ